MTARRRMRVADCVEHILDGIDRIETYAAGLTEAAFFDSPLVQDAITRNPEIVGEAANQIQMADATCATANPAVELDAAYQMRNALAHGYYAVNVSTVWTTVQRDLPKLKSQLLPIQAALRSSGA